MNTFSIIRRLGVGAAASMVALAACIPSANPAAIGKTLAQLDSTWAKAATTRNADSVASFYAADALVYPPNQRMALDKGEARNVWASYLGDSTVVFTWKAQHAAGSKGGDLGFTAGVYERSFPGPDGKRVSETGKYVCVWARQQDGSWKAIHHIWNADSNMAAGGPVH